MEGGEGTKKKNKLWLFHIYCPSFPSACLSAWLTDCLLLSVCKKWKKKKQSSGWVFLCFEVAFLVMCIEVCLFCLDWALLCWVSVRFSFVETQSLFLLGGGCHNKEEFALFLQTVLASACSQSVCMSFLNVCFLTVRQGWAMYCKVYTEKLCSASTSKKLGNT